MYLRQHGPLVLFPQSSLGTIARLAQRHGDRLEQIALGLTCKARDSLRRTPDGGMAKFRSYLLIDMALTSAALARSRWLSRAIERAILSRSPMPISPLLSAPS